MHTNCQSERFQELATLILVDTLDSFPDIFGQKLILHFWLKVCASNSVEGAEEEKSNTQK